MALSGGRAAASCHPVRPGRSEPSTEACCHPGAGQEPIIVSLPPPSTIISFLSFPGASGSYGATGSHLSRLLWAYYVPPLGQLLHQPCGKRQ